MKETKVSKFFSNYSWIFYFVSAAFILAMSIVIKAVPSSVYYIIGFVLLIFGLFRIGPMFKTTYAKFMKFVYLAEMVVQIGFGAYFVYLANQEKDTELFGYFLGGIIYLRGLVHLIWCAVSKEKDNLFLFFIHIGLITIGSMIFVTKGFSSEKAGWYLLLIGVACCFVISKDGYNKYKKYRYDKLIKEETTKIETDEAIKIDIKEEEKIEEITNVIKEEENNITSASNSK